MASHELTGLTPLVQPCRLSAVHHVRRMRGGTQAHLMYGSDGAFYVVKFQNNPHHVRVLANELLATRLALSLDLPMAEAHVIEVSEDLIAGTPELRIELAERLIPCSSGLQVASRFVADPIQDWIHDYLPETIFHKINNIQDFARVLAFDKWAGNCDGRQAVFSRRAGRAEYQASFIDQGYCFNAGQWTFPDLPLMGVYHQNHVYRQVTGWESFEPVISRIEQFDPAELWECASKVPEEWYEGDTDAISRLVEALYNRRSSVRDLISRFRNSCRRRFLSWREN